VVDEYSGKAGMLLPLPLLLLEGAPAKAGGIEECCAANCGAGSGEASACAGASMVSWRDMVGVLMGRLESHCLLQQLGRRDGERAVRGI
jgi:hypothetical protein